MRQENLFSQGERNELKQMGIEQKDERHMALADAAKARAYELMMCLYAIAIVLLAVFDVISLLAFFALLGTFALCQIYFIFRLWKYHKEM